MSDRKESVKTIKGALNNKDHRLQYNNFFDVLFDLDKGIVHPHAHSPFHGASEKLNIEDHDPQKTLMILKDQEILQLREEIAELESKIKIYQTTIRSLDGHPSELEQAVVKYIRYFVFMAMAGFIFFLILVALIHF